MRGQISTQVTALPEGNWELIKSETTRDGLFWVGKAEECTFEFSFLPEQIPGIPTMAGWIASALKTAVGQENGKVLSYKLYLDRAEWYRSRWLCVCVAHGSPLAWYAILGIIAAILLIIAWIIHDTKGLLWFGPAVILIGIGVAAGGVAALVKRKE